MRTVIGQFCITKYVINALQMLAKKRRSGKGCSRNIHGVIGRDNDIGLCLLQSLSK